MIMFSLNVMAFDLGAETVVIYRMSLFEFDLHRSVKIFPFFMPAAYL